MSATVDVHLGAGTERSLADDVREGLTRPFKEIPPKHLYDSRGSELFERISQLPEYYPTRTETAILAERAAEIVEAADRPDELVELGSGSTLKARTLLEAMSPARRYVPVDVSERMVREAAAELADDYPGLAVHGVVGDFERHLGEVPAPAGAAPRLVALLGGTIGNFAPGARRSMLRDVRAMLRPGDRFLVGTDLVKDRATLEAAYDDAAGVTAEFNRNLLHVVNRELDADFDPDRFEHVAFYDPHHEWIEMRLRAREALTVRIRDLGLRVEFAAGEELRTEISAKFTPERVRAECAAAGMELERTWTDDDRLFGLSLARAV